MIVNNLINLLSLDGKTIIPEGAQIIKKGAHKKPIPMYGHVSSSYYSGFSVTPLQWQ